MNWTRGAFGGLVGGGGVMVGYGLGSNVPLLVILGTVGFLAGMVQLRRLDGR